MKFMRVSGFLCLALITSTARAQTVTVGTTQFQVVEGFGVNGVANCWTANPSSFYTNEWAQTILEDLGITVIRNEIFPPSYGTQVQPDWSVQAPPLVSLKQRADAAGIPLKFLTFVGSPPLDLKCDSNEATNPSPAPWMYACGGSLVQSKAGNFATWLATALNQYKTAGLDPYGVSIQQAPYHSGASYPNSCYYTPSLYNPVLITAYDAIHPQFPNLKFYGGEEFLESEGCCSGTVYSFASGIKESPEAASRMGAYAVVSSDLPTANVSTYWSNFYNYVDRPVWNTSTDGFVDAWMGGLDSQGAQALGARDLAQAVYSALSFGHASLWLWGQGACYGSPEEQVLMPGGQKGKRFYVLKQFYRWIRPGARMIGTTSSDSSILAVTFTNSASPTFSAVLLNTSSSDKTVTLNGFPSQFNAYRTSETENAASLGVITGAEITLPASSVTTVVSVDSVPTDGGVDPDGGADGKRRIDLSTHGCACAEYQSLDFWHLILMLGVFFLVTRLQKRQRQSKSITC